MVDWSALKPWSFRRLGKGNALPCRPFLRRWEMARYRQFPALHWSPMSATCPPFSSDWSPDRTESNLKSSPDPQCERPSLSGATMHDVHKLSEFFTPSLPLIRLFYQQPWYKRWGWVFSHNLASVFWTSYMHVNFPKQWDEDSAGSMSKSIVESATMKGTFPDMLYWKRPRSKRSQLPQVLPCPVIK